MSRIDLDTPGRAWDNDTVLEVEVVVGTEAAPSRQISMLQAIHDFRESSATDRVVMKRRWQVLLFGQAVAVSAASTNASSFILQYKLGVVLPLFQMSIMYMILSSYLCDRKPDQENNTLADEDPWHDGLYDSSSDQPPAKYRLAFLGLRLRIPWWIYLAISLLDVEANYMTLLSFRFSSLTSTTLLGSLTVPSVMFFSRHVLNRVFGTCHYVGVCLCLLGGTMMVWSDLGGTSTADISSADHSYIGDMLSVAAALLFGLGDTVAEYAIKHIDRNEYLGMTGLFGCIISGLQCLIVERGTLMNLVWSPQIVCIMVWYIVSLVFFYVSATYFLASSEATMLKLSLQTTSLWACLFSVVAVGAIPPPVFYVAVLLVASGVCIYELADKVPFGKLNPIADEFKELKPDGHQPEYLSSES